MSKCTLVLKFNKNDVYKVDSVYNYFIRLYNFEGAYFFYNDNIIIVDVLKGGINFLSDPERRFSVGILNYVVLYFYDKQYSLVHQYFKQVNTGQIFRNMVVYPIPLNWLSPEQTVSRYAADKLTMLNTYTKVLSTGYKVTSYLTNIQDTDIYVTGGVIQWEGLPKKTRPNQQPLLIKNNKYKIKSPEIIEGILIYPVPNQLLTTNDIVTITPYTNGANYPLPQTFVTNANNLFTSTLFNIQLNNNIVNINDASFETTFDIDIVFYTKRALLGLDNLYYFNLDITKSFRKYEISELPKGKYNILTDEIDTTSSWRILDLTSNANSFDEEGLTAFYPMCENYSSDFEFIYFSPETATSSKLKAYTQSNTCDGNIISWNRLIVNINPSANTPDEFYLYPSEPHSAIIQSNLSFREPINGPITNNEVKNAIQSSYFNISNNVSQNAYNNYYAFITNNFTQSSIRNTTTLVNRADPDTSVWITSALDNINTVQTKPTPINIHLTSVGAIKNCLYMTRRGLLPYYYLNFDMSVTVTIASDVTLTPNIDGYAYSPKIFIPNQIIMPKYIGFNIFSLDRNFYNFNVIQCNTFPRRNREWQNYTFYTFEKNYYCMRVMNINPFQRRILTNNIVNFEVKLLIYVK